MDEEEVLPAARGSSGHRAKMLCFDMKYLSVLQCAWYLFCKRLDSSLLPEQPWARAASPMLDGAVLGKAPSSGGNQNLTTCRH